MNAREVRRWVNTLVANALRKDAPHVTTGRIGPLARQSDVKKVRIAMLAMADKLHPVEKPAHEPEARSPGPVEGPHDLPEDSDAASARDATPPAGKH